MFSNQLISAAITDKRAFKEDNLTHDQQIESYIRGSPTGNAKICRSCGSPNQLDKNFSTKCGNKLD